MPSPKIINRIFQTWSLFNLAALILALSLPCTGAYGDRLNGFQCISLVEFWLTYNINLVDILPALVLAVSCGLGWYLTFRSRPFNTLRLQWLCMLLVIIAASLLLGAQNYPDKATFFTPWKTLIANSEVMNALLGLLLASILSAVAYLVVSLIRELPGKFMEGSSLLPILWSGGALWLIVFVGLFVLPGYGGATRIFDGLQLLFWVWLSMWLCEFFRASLKSPTDLPSLINMPNPFNKPERSA